MRISYDKEADALAIWFEGVSSAKTIDVTQDIFIDTDEDGKLAGIEVLHASEKTNLGALFSVSFADFLEPPFAPGEPGSVFKGNQSLQRMRARLVKLSELKKSKEEREAEQILRQLGSGEAIVVDLEPEDKPRRLTGLYKRVAKSLGKEVRVRRIDQCLRIVLIAP